MRRKGAFDHILLETTGLADPGTSYINLKFTQRFNLLREFAGPIASLFWQNEEFAMGLAHDIRLDGVVCVVDAVFGRQQMEEDHASDGIGESLRSVSSRATQRVLMPRRQIAAADVILLNKVDLVSPEEADATESMTRGINPAASFYRTVRGR